MSLSDVIFAEKKWQQHKEALKRTLNEQVKIPLLEQIVESLQER